MDKTTMMATAKIIVGVLALAVATFGHTIPVEVKEAMIGLTGSGYLVFSWLQGLFTKDKEKSNEHIGD